MRMGSEKEEKSPKVKTKVLVSACLLGRNCKYNGGSNYSRAVGEFLKDKEIVAVCPEVMGGLAVPRTPVELVGGRAVSRTGEDVTSFFRKGTEEAVKIAADAGIRTAILQSRSPSCGVKEIYDGTFTGRLIPGKGMLARALEEAGVKLMDASEFSE
jgi:uncharacterized protein YbbK (DUF523 family)